MPEMARHEGVFCRSSAWGWAARRFILPWALQGIELQGEVLEIGAGAGAMAAEIARRFPNARLMATDFDETMVDRARARVNAVQADATALPFEAGRFDAVLSFLMLHHVGRWEAALGEAARVLRPDGLLLGYDVLDKPVVRALHGFRTAHGERFPTLAQLDLELSIQPFKDVWIRPTTGSVARFRATRR
jgi:ubiquinone/menaquinone biosynthesis C-methylase UbiE